MHNKLTNSRRLLVPFLGALALGIGLRLFQLDNQILIDDEWHAVHQLLQRQPSEILLSFGANDYSIPLTLLYWLEATHFGLSEFGMRWPSLLCAIAALVLFSLYSWRTLSARHATLFAYLLAISPALVLYARVARPYSVTLFLAYVAHFAFDAYCRAGKHRRWYGALYGASAVVAAWTHILAGPLVVAPFVHQLFCLPGMTPDQRRTRVRELLLLGLPTATCMSLLILPPLLADGSALAGKSGADSPDLETVIGTLYWWIGTGSGIVVGLTVLLAAIGFPAIWRRLSVVRTLCTGVALTLAILLLARPAWIHNPLTFGRYLFPVIPLILCAAAAGAVRLADLVPRAASFPWVLPAAAILGFPALATAARSPLLEIFVLPNSNIANPYFFFDFRPGRNPLAKQFERYAPLSSFWQQLGANKPGSLRVAAAPFYFESYSWQAPRWERISRQTVVPAFLSGFCVDKRLAEVPRDARFKFRNVVFVADDADIARKRIDLISYQKPYVVMREDGAKIYKGEETRQCESALRQRFGRPKYEDDKIVVFSAHNNQ